MDTIEPPRQAKETYHIFLFGKKPSKKFNIKFHMNHKLNVKKWCKSNCSH